MSQPDPTHLSRLRDVDPGRSPDLHRPTYHVSPTRGWLNDPNGLIRWNGRYHMFFQHNPDRAAWGAPHWAHMVSDDLVRWKERPIALTPGMAPADDGGCWSGCAVDDDGTPVIVYTGVQQGEQTTCLAFGSDDLDVWEKYPGNPVARAPHGEPITRGAYRDPFVWRANDGWYQVIGTSFHDHGQVLLYRSNDLRSWEYVGPLLRDEDWRATHGNGAIWECPNLIALGDLHVLVLGVWTPDGMSRVIAMVGEFDGRWFEPERIEALDHGLRSYTAPQILRDGDRVLAFGWMQEQRSAAAQIAAGWSGVMSLPRDVSLGKDGSLRHAFAPELTALRGQRWRVSGRGLDGDRMLDVGGRAIELRARFRRGAARRVGIGLLRSSDGAEETRVVLDWDERSVTVDKARASLDPEVSAADERGELPEAGDTIDVHLYLDHSVLELIVDGRSALSTRLYPTREDAEGMRVFAEGGALEGFELEGWGLG